MTDISDIENFTPRPPADPPKYRLDPLDLDLLEDDIPIEYRGAELSEGLKVALNEWPVSMALIGPPGTGKTRYCWAALRSQRIKKAKWYLDNQSEPKRLEDGFNRISRTATPSWVGILEWTHGVVKKIQSEDCVRIISEVADIRRHRHDRDWLDSVANWTPPASFRGSLLCVDDIGFTGKADDWVMEAIYHIANVRRSHGHSTLWTSNLSPDELRNVFGAAIASRILGGLLLPIEGADHRLK